MQKSAVKVILQDQYNGYQNGLAKLGLENLNQRRENLCLEFAKKCTKHEKLQHMFPKHQKEHSMETRYNEVYKINMQTHQSSKIQPFSKCKNFSMMMN